MKMSDSPPGGSTCPPVAKESGAISHEKGRHTSPRRTRSLRITSFG